MRRPPLSPALSRPRPGKILVLFALLLPVLLGLVGLVIDMGLLWSAYRQTQNTADAAAMAAAFDMFRGDTNANALVTANAFVTADSPNSPALALNGGATNALNIPPQSGAYAGKAHYAEAIVSRPVTTSFIQVLGVNRNQTVKARAVAGYEQVGNGEGAIVLDPTAAPGLSVTSNNTRLIVNGTVVVNSQGSGLDAYGNTVPNTLYAQTAVSTGGKNITPAPIVVQDLQVVGGVDTPTNVRLFDSAFGSPNYYDTSNNTLPIIASSPIAPDPLIGLPTPSSATGVQNVFYDASGNKQSAPQDISVTNGQTVSLQQGIYRTISVTGGTLNLASGIYVVGPTFSGNGKTFYVNGGTVTGTNVMIYNTGSDYTASSPPDATDGSTTPPKNQTANYGSIYVNGGTVNLTPISGNDPNFPNMLFYQRRWNTQNASIGGNSNNINLTGTIYDKWGLFQLAGQGKYDAQFVVGSMAITGGAAVTINASGKNFGVANLVFLVE